MRALGIGCSLALLLGGCAFQMKMVAPPGKNIQFASDSDVCHTIGSHFFYFFDEQKVAERDLAKIGDHKKARVTVRQNFWEIMLNGASFGLLNMGSLRVEECD
jgi:hypothetical protein